VTQVKENVSLEFIYSQRRAYGVAGRAVSRRFGW
jgi:hypothetical protein